MDVLWSIYTVRFTRTSHALGGFLRGGLALTLDAQLVALLLADAVVGGDGDVLHILDLRDTRVRRSALVFVGAHADLIQK